MSNDSSGFYHRLNAGFWLFAVAYRDARSLAKSERRSAIALL
jgi:hypothetical protein